MPRYVIGDIHGRINAVREVFDRSGFDMENDQLVLLGDVVDGGGMTKELIEFLLQVKHRILIRGNHDQWALGWFDAGIELPAWVHQGGTATMRSYGFDYKSVPESHREFLHSGIYYYIDDKNNIFVHGGFDPDINIKDNSNEELLWNRNIIGYAMCRPIPGYNRVFIGHTTTQLVENHAGRCEPIMFNNLVMMDTGGGWDGKLTLMNPDTLDYWQSGLQKKPRKWFDDMDCVPVKWNRGARVGMHQDMEES